MTSLLATSAAQQLCERLPRERVVQALREQMDACRSILGADGARDAALSPDGIAARAGERLAQCERARLQDVVNATGIVIHTNLGRAPLSQAALDTVARIAGSYSNLEFDLEAGKRGSRADGAEQALRRLTGAESAAIVNNNAAAVMLTLAAIAGGGEVIISRGELVEIGGSFRIPDVLALSGAKLVEVGTTNRTHLRDYEQAITPETRAILRVHASNYRIVGFTKSVPLPELARLAARSNIVLMEDLGSGAFVDLSAFGLPKEPTPQESLGSGADIVTFSGDKLLGGPQAGMIVGRGDLVAAMTRHPLYRALRADKMCLAALDATLRVYEQGAETARAELPVLRMLTQTGATLLRRAESLAESLNLIPGVTATVEPAEGYAGGGSLPEMALPSYAVRVDFAGVKAHDLAEALRRSRPPVIGTVSGDALRLDVRTVDDNQIAVIASAIAALVERRGLNQPID